MAELVHDIDFSTITGLTQDSRAVKPGFLFAAFVGEKHDGRDYIGAAIASGASVILAPEGTVLDKDVMAQLITDAQPRKVLAQFSSAFYKDQPDYSVAVTGTNGKTSVVDFTAQIWSSMGCKAESLGTLSGALTTPDSVALHEKLSGMAGDGITHLALEASSHGLSQYRLDGVKLSAAGFTNLSRDHLDYHEDMEAYLVAKTRLFSEVLPPDGVAVLNADVPEYKMLKEICAARDIRIFDYGHEGHNLRLISCEALPQGQDVALELGGAVHKFTLPLVGEFQLMNALCALGLVIVQRPDDAQWIESAVEALPSLHSVRGRLEPLEDTSIYIDYAHTPDALEHALKALRPHTKGKLICVFGCGGDRDTGKRPLMGEVAARLADQVIITDDNPRSENPDSIRNAILKGCPDALEISDRRDALMQGIKNLGAGDVLLIAGKGHEQGQIFADQVEPFDDLNEAKIILQTLSHNSLNKQEQ